MSNPAAPSGRLWGYRPVNVSTRWLRGNLAGLLVMALAVGVVAGFGAAGFRYLIYLFTWLATGHIHPLSGANPSDHLPFLGHWFYLIIPIVGGALYGPFIYRFAREARGHGVPEVMIAVAEHGGRIRPRVSFVKALASAMCIGVGGSVGREGPIVQVGSTLGSTLGQWIRMSETRIRILVACGAAGGIAATFNAPMTGVFFGFELILREFSIESLFAIFVSAVSANVISEQFFGSAPFFPNFPHTLSAHHVYEYLLVAVLGVVAGLIGVAFKAVLYKTEDVCDRIWHNRPEWARPAVGGVALGVLLLLLPQMYGVGYPVMGDVVGHPSHFALWFLIVLMLGKMLAASLTIGIGGSGGVFAPSLFTGAMAGTAFGMIVHAIFGSAVGPPALYGMVAMGAVFASAAQAPLTSLASVVEMTGDFSLTLPVMLAVGISAAVSKTITHGTIYTTKLLRRGTDIDRPTPSSVFHRLTVADAMQPLPAAADRTNPSHPVFAHTTEQATALSRGDGHADWERLAGPVLRTRQPQVLFSDESLIQGLRQLVLYGRDGLPVTSSDSHRLIGWVTNRNVLSAVNERLEASVAETEQGQLAADFAEEDAEAKLHRPKAPLRGYEILEITVTPEAVATGQTVGTAPWPEGSLVVATTHRGKTIAADDDTELEAGDRITVLTPAQ